MAVFVLLAFLLCVVFIFGVRALTRVYTLVDVPDGHLKPHVLPVSLLGGVAMFLAFMTVIWGFTSQQYPVFAFLFLIFGLIDDVLWKDSKKSKPLLKLFFQIILVSVFGYWFSLPFWILLIFFVIINSINTSDGLDGLAGVLVLISLIGMGLVSDPLLPSVLGGALLGFLIFNLPPASIFMGDNGSYFLGFMMAYFVAMHFSWAMLLIVGMPLIDLVFVTISRAVAGKSLMRGGRDHLYDRLYRKVGKSLPQTLLIYGCIQAIVVGAGVALFFV